MSEDKNICPECGTTLVHGLHHYPDPHCYLYLTDQIASAIKQLGGLTYAEHVNKIMALQADLATAQKELDSAKAEIERLKEYEWKYKELCK